MNKTAEYSIDFLKNLMASRPGAFTEEDQEAIIEYYKEGLENTSWFPFDNQSPVPVITLPYRPSHHTDVKYFWE